MALSITIWANIVFIFVTGIAAFVLIVAYRKIALGLLLALIMILLAAPVHIFGSESASYLFSAVVTMLLYVEFLVFNLVPYLMEKPSQHSNGTVGPAENASS